MRRPGIAVTYMAFDLLSIEGEDPTRAPYSERRAQLEALDLNGVCWQTPETFDDGPALFEAVVRPRARGCCRQATGWPLSTGRAWLGEDEEPAVLALGDGARERDQQAARQAVRLAGRVHL